MTRLVWLIVQTRAGAREVFSAVRWMGWFPGISPVPGASLKPRACSPAWPEAGRCLGARQDQRNGAAAKLLGVIAHCPQVTPQISGHALRNQTCSSARASGAC